MTEDAGEEDSDGQEQADRNGSIQSKEQSDGVAEDGCPVKKESKSVIHFDYLLLDCWFYFGSNI